MSGHRATIQAGYTMIHHANLERAADWLGCGLSHASSELRKNLSMTTITNRNMMGHRQILIRSLREEPRPDWDARFTEIAGLERELAPFFTTESASKDALEDDAVAQFSFQHELLRPINHIPFAVAIIAFFKVWAVPVMTVLTPILAWILPYILLKFVYALPIQQDQYREILQSLWTGNLSLSPTEQIRSLWSGRSIAQMAIFAFSFIQSLVQPIQNAIHLYKMDRIFYGLGEKLIRLRNLVRSFRQDLGPLNGPHVKISFSLEGMGESDSRAAFMLVKEQPERLHIVLRDLARLEVMWRISKANELQPVEFTPEQFTLKGVLDISLERGVGVASTIDLSGAGATHAVLTGPNGGGKSSFLRGTLQSVILGHTYGFAPAKEARMPFFSWIASGLQLRDTPGSLSMFETEVKFAAECLKRRDMYEPGLVLFDELFHSTNPPDGIRTAERFLDGLWKRRDVYSIVSTHVFSLVESAPKNVLPICCSATRTEKGEIEFQYEVVPGICRVSSVDKVWARFGLGESAVPEEGAAGAFVRETA